MLCELVRVDLDLHWSSGQPVNLDTTSVRLPSSRGGDVLSQIAFEGTGNASLPGTWSPEEYQLRFVST